MNSTKQVLLSLLQTHFGAIFGYSGALLLIFVLLMFGASKFDQFLNYALAAWFASIMTYIAKSEGLPMPESPPKPATLSFENGVPQIIEEPKK